MAFPTEVSVITVTKFPRHGDAWHRERSFQSAALVSMVALVFELLRAARFVLPLSYNSILCNDFICLLGVVSKVTFLDGHSALRPRAPMLAAASVESG